MTMTSFEYENVNGIMLTLVVGAKSDSPKSRKFIISYKKCEEKKSSWSRASLLFAAIFNMIAMYYVRISFTAVTIIIIVLSFLVFFWITHSVQSETIIVVPTVGVQSSVKYVYGKEDNFIPWSSIDDVIINEVIKMNRVLYFLTILTKTSSDSSGEESEGMKLIPLFKYTKPRLQMLERIYCELQNLLAEDHNLPSQGSGDTG